MGPEFLRRAAQMIKFLALMINIAVFVLLIIVLYDSWPIDTEKSRALLACCIIGFIFTQLIIIGRMSARYISLLPDVIIGLFMVIFNIVAGTIALEESKPLYDTTSTVGVKSFRSIRNYLTAGALTVVNGIVYLFDTGISLMQYVNENSTDL